MNQKESIRAHLEKLAQTDIRTVDPNSLVDISTVKIDTTLPKEERIKDYIRQVQNPYCYRDHGVAVKISFSGKRTMEDCLTDAIQAVNPADLDER